MCAPRTSGCGLRAPPGATRLRRPWRPGSPRVRRAPAAPHIDRGKQEQPYHVDEMPVPGSRLEAEMLPGREVTLGGADQADGQEDGANDHVETVEARRHEEGRAV